MAKTVVDLKVFRRYTRSTSKAQNQNRPHSSLTSAKRGLGSDAHDQKLNQNQNPRHPFSSLTSTKRGLGSDAHDQKQNQNQISPHPFSSLTSAKRGFGSDAHDQKLNQNQNPRHPFSSLTSTKRGLGSDAHDQKLNQNQISPHPFSSLTSAKRSLGSDAHDQKLNQNQNSPHPFSSLTLAKRSLGSDAHDQKLNQNQNPPHPLSSLTSAKRSLGSDAQNQNQISPHPFSSLTPAKRCLGSASTSSAQKPQTPFSSQPSAIVSATEKTVFLKDWWLIKVNGKGLAVGGFAWRLGLGVREYNSPVILKRHCATTLETSDGMTISIDGSLNMSRTHQNGFPYEVCVQFLHGFPYNWEEHADLDVSKGTCAAAKSNILLAKSENNSLPSLNDLPVSAVRDYLLSTLGHSDDDLLIQNIYNDMPGTSRNETSESSGVSMDSKPKRKRSASKPKRKRSVKEESWARYIPTAQDRSVGVCTRSMSRRK